MSWMTLRKEVKEYCRSANTRKLRGKCSDITIIEKFEGECKVSPLGGRIFGEPIQGCGAGDAKKLEKKWMTWQ
jgi:hypothetical protein